MTSKRKNWALVLAGGEGKRLNDLTMDTSGRPIPKQFCSLNGGLSLLQETVRRAASLVPTSRIAVAVAAQHRQWWRPLLRGVPAENRIEQPENRGTAIGILLPLLHIANRDPDASLVILPSDHFVADERPLRRTISRGLREIESSEGGIVLLGIEPDRADPELGYILPVNGGAHLLRGITHFVEKPEAALAARLLQQGALWNSFILVASVQSLLDLYVARFPEVVQAMIGALTVGRAYRQAELQHLYQRLPEIDFSRHLMAGAEPALRVLHVPNCGWSDLGTPKRVGETLARLDRFSPSVRAHAPAFLNLASAHLRLQSVA